MNARPQPSLKIRGADMPGFLDRGAAPRPINISERGLEALERSLKIRCAALQENEDKRGAEWIAALPDIIFSPESAFSASNQFGGAWFDRQLWSHEVKKNALKALIRAVSVYPPTDDSAWRKYLVKLESME